MKKVLFGTTALVAAGMAMPAEAADPIKLSVGGYMWQWAGLAFNRDVSAEDVRKNLAQNAGAQWGGTGAIMNYLGAGLAGGGSSAGREYGNFAVGTDAEIHFKGSTKLDNGLNIAVQIEIEAQRSATSTARNADQQWMELSGGWGALSVGERFHVNHRMHNSAPQAGTIFADTTYFVFPANGNGQGGLGNVTGGAFHWTSAEGLDQMGRQNVGIDYMTPRVWGFQLGLSYIPTKTTAANASGQSSAWGMSVANQENNHHDAMGGALNYTNKFGPVTVAADAGYVRFQTQQGIGTFTASGVVSAASTGLRLSGWGFTVGGSYQRIFDNLKLGGSTSTVTTAVTAGTSITAAHATSMDGYMWDAGVMYENGPYAIGLAYFSSSMEGMIQNCYIFNSGSVNGSGSGCGGKDQYQIAQLTAKYTMGPGVDLVGSAAWLNFQDEISFNTTGSAALKDYQNSWGWTVYTGVKLAF